MSILWCFSGALHGALEGGSGLTRGGDRRRQRYGQDQGDMDHDRTEE